MFCSVLDLFLPRWSGLHPVLLPVLLIKHIVYMICWKLFWGGKWFHTLCTWKQGPLKVSRFENVESTVKYVDSYKRVLKHNLNSLCFFLIFVLSHLFIHSLFVQDCETKLFLLLNTKPKELLQYFIHPLHPSPWLITRDAKQAFDCVERQYQWEINLSILNAQS